MGCMAETDPDQLTPEDQERARTEIREAFETGLRVADVAFDTEHALNLQDVRDAFQEAEKHEPFEEPKRG